MTRLTHWINLLCVAVLLMSGLQIFNAHPALYWGQSGADADRPAFEIGADNSGDGPPVGFARIGSSTFTTTGILGVSRDASGEVVQRGVPRWVTLPSWRDLALGRRWHFFFAWAFPDHAWATTHPEYFITGSDEDLERDPASFVRVGARVLANGRDPYFPPGPTSSS